MVRPVHIGAAVVAVLVLAILVFYVRRKYTGGNETEGVQRVTQSDQGRGHSVPIRRRASQMPLPAKVLLGLVTVLFAFIAWNVYSYMRTGSPTQVFYSTWTSHSATALIGGLLTVAIVRRVGAAEQMAYALIEDPIDDDGERHVKEIPFRTDDTQTDGDGEVIFQYTDSKVLGLVRRPKRHAEDRGLRNDPDVVRPLGEKIGHRVPDQFWELPNGDLAWKTKGDVVNASPDTLPDIEYKPQFGLTAQQYLRYQSDMSMMQREVNEVKTQLARADETIRELRQLVENHSERSWDETLQVISNLAPYLSGDHRSFDVLNQQTPPGGHSGEGGRAGQSRDGERGENGLIGDPDTNGSESQ